MPDKEPVVVPVPPFATGTVPKDRTGVFPPDETMGDVPVTLVTASVTGVVQLKEPALAPAVNTLPLFVVLFAGICRFPSPVGCE